MFTINKLEQQFTLKSLLVGNTKRLIKKRKLDISPIVFLRFNTKTKGEAKIVTLKALLDTGASATLVASKHVSKLKLNDNTTTTWKTTGGNFLTGKTAKVQFTIPEMHQNRLVTKRVHVTNADMGYDMIIGMDLLTELGIDILNSNSSIKWDEAEIPMRPRDSTIEDSYVIEDPQAVQDSTNRINNILDAKYNAANLKQVVTDSINLNKEEKAKLHKLLLKYEDMFDGTLGKWNGTPHSIHLKDNVTPYHGKAYKIPHAYEATLKKEVQRLCEIGVLKKVNHSQWAAPCFVIPKKDKTVRFLSNFRELNKRIKRYPFPIPNIQDLLLKLEGFTHATALDLNMGYYHIELCPDSKKLCTIVLPWGKYEYQKLPMGLSNSPDIFQENMSNLFRDLDFVREYIDDLLITTTGNLEDHLTKVDTVLSRLRKAGLQVNAKKSFFCRHEVDYLGYLITRDGSTLMTSSLPQLET